MSLKKGMKVYVRHTSGDERGRVDTEQIYLIRSIGTKQAVLDYQDDGKKHNPFEPRRGRQFTLYTKEQAEEYTRNSGNYLYPWHWSQLLVPLGQVGWDPEINVL